MTSKERIRAILNNEPADRVGFWVGNPVDETKHIYYTHFGIKTEKEHIRSGKAERELALATHSDLIWITPEFDDACWNHPENKPMWDVLGGKKRTSLAQPGVFAECEDVKEVERFDWPNPDYIDFNVTLEKVERARAEGLAVFGGMWCSFFHLACDFFGMEEYFVKMHTHPDVVHAVTRHIVDFYLETNTRCFDLMGDKLDAAFFGNDFGSQQDLLFSPRAFRKFIFPYYKEIIDQMKSYHLKVITHSCGAIMKIIPALIEAGIDVLHPLQAKAVGMEPEKLVEHFKDDLIFIGGVDTQELLPFGNSEQVRQEVRRLKSIFKEGFIVSPSHEALLPNVSIENVIAMSEEARTH